MARRSTGKVRAFVGRVNQSPAAAYVECDAPDWLTPAAARKLAQRLLQATGVAEARFAYYQRTGKVKRSWGWR